MLDHTDRYNGHLAQMVTTVGGGELDLQEKRKPSRPRVNPEVEELVVRIQHENPLRGSRRVVGAQPNSGIYLSDTTVDNFRKRHGVKPAPMKRNP